MKRIQVLSLIEDFYCSGGEYRLLNLARYIDRSRFDHKIVCIKRETSELAERYGSMRDDFCDSGSEIIDLNFDNVRAHSSNSTAFWMALAAARMVTMITRLRELVRGLQVDVIDGHLTTGNRIGTIAGALTGTPAMVTTYFHQERFSPAALYYITQQMTYHMASAIMTDAVATRDEIERWMLRRRARCFVVPNGSAPPDPQTPKREIMARYGIPEDKLVIGMIARLVPSKGQLVFLRAAKEILKSHPQCVFLIVGFVRGSPPFTYGDEVGKLAKDLGISNSVRIFGYPGAIGDVWQMIDIHVHPALKESLPDAIIQGMSLRKPQVVTGVGGIATMVEHGVSGFVAPPNDPVSIAHYVSRLINDPELARRFGDQAYSRYSLGYTGEAMARGIEDAFLQVCR